MHAEPVDGFRTDEITRIHRISRYNPNMNRTISAGAESSSAQTIFTGAL